MEPGDLVTLSSKAGYGIAFHPLRKGEDPKPPIDIPDGTSLLFVGPDDFYTDIKMQPMVFIMLRDKIFSIDKRFLAPVPDRDPVV